MEHPNYDRDRLSQVRQRNRKLEAENKALRESFEQEAIRLLNIIKQLKTENEKFKIALDHLARLGNGEFLSNIIGNVIAQNALKGNN